MSVKIKWKPVAFVVILVIGVGTGAAFFLDGGKGESSPTEETMNGTTITTTTTTDSNTTTTTTTTTTNTTENQSDTEYTIETSESSKTVESVTYPPGAGENRYTFSGRHTDGLEDAGGYAVRSKVFAKSGEKSETNIRFSRVDVSTREAYVRHYVERPSKWATRVNYSTSAKTYHRITSSELEKPFYKQSENVFRPSDGYIFNFNEFSYFNYKAVNVLESGNRTLIVYKVSPGEEYRESFQKDGYNITSFDGRLIVDTSGVIHSAEYDVVVTNGTRTAEEHYRFVLEDLGSQNVTEPDWTSKTK